MQFVRDIIAAQRAAGRPVISFEFFTPKTEEGEHNLLQKTIPALCQLHPAYASVTYGAGGSTRDKTLSIVAAIQQLYGLTAMAHLTCVGHSRGQIGGILEQARGRGIKNLLALRGDPPGGVGEFKPAPDGFEFAHQLVDFIRGFGDFSTGVAAFPEGHIACREGKFVDWERLQAKIERGADFAITQLFFDNRHFYEMRDFLVKRGVTVPIIPGVIAITSGTQIKKFTAMCGASLPGSLVVELERLGDNDEATTEFGIEFAARQCAELLREGAPGIYFYTLNKARSTTAILKHLGLPPAPGGRGPG